jgi:hypothetical protein
MLAWSSITVTIGDGADPVARTLSIISLLFSAAALLWAVWQWVLSGPRVRAELAMEMKIGGSSVRRPEPRYGRWMPAVLRGLKPWVGPVLPASVPYGMSWVVIVAINQGRLPVDIAHVRVETSAGSYWSSSSEDSDLPFRLEPHSQKEWRVAIADAENWTRNAESKKRNSARFRGALTLGSGKVVRTRLSYDIVKAVRADPSIDEPD